MTGSIDRFYREETLSAAVYDRIAEINVRIWEPHSYERTLMCVPGYMGNGGDFAFIAQMLADRGMRVVAPDMIGRGKSTYFGELRYYTLNSYIRCLRAVRTRLLGPQFSMIATSAGGLHALYLCKADGISPDRLILNDVPIVIDARVADINLRIAQEIRQVFTTEAEAVERFRTTRSEMTFGSDEIQKKFARNRMVLTDSGYRYAIDPAIADQRSDAAGRRYEITDALAGVSGRILMLYGSGSDFKDLDTALGLQPIFPNLTVKGDFDGGHPLSLTCPREVETIVEFLS